MTAQARALLREALALPEQDRADVAAELLASLDAPAAEDTKVVLALWSQELEQRAKRALSGEAIGEDCASARERPDPL